MKKYKLVYLYCGGYLIKENLNLLQLLSNILFLKFQGIDFEYEKVL